MIIIYKEYNVNSIVNNMKWKHLKLNHLIDIVNI